MTTESVAIGEAYYSFMQLVTRMYLHTPILVDPDEFEKVLKRLMSFYMDERRTGFVGPALKPQEAAARASTYMRDMYHSAINLVESHSSFSADNVDWSTIRRLVSGLDPAACWVVALRMSHESGDFGEREKVLRERARAVQADLSGVMTLLRQNGVPI